jgi:hypothetical protein
VRIVIGGPPAAIGYGAFVQFKPEAPCYLMFATFVCIAHRAATALARPYGQGIGRDGGVDIHGHPFQMAVKGLPP